MYSGHGTRLETQRWRGFQLSVIYLIEAIANALAVPAPPWVLLSLRFGVLNSPAEPNPTAWISCAEGHAQPSLGVVSFNFYWASGRVGPVLNLLLTGSR